MDALGRIKEEENAIIKDEKYSQNDIKDEKIEGCEKKYEFENILKQIGCFGKYQIRVYLLTALLDIPAAMVMFFFFVAGATPSWQCKDETNNFTMYSGMTEIGINVTVPLTEGVCINGTACGQLEPIFDPTFTSIVSEFGLICDTKYIGTVINTALMGGVFAGAFISGQLADTLGRRNVFYSESLLLQLSMFCTAFASSWQTFAVLRFSSGLLLGGCLLIGFIIPLEMMGKEWRTLCGTISAWNIGIMLLALFAYLIPNWRHCAMAISIMWLPLFLQYFVVPESPRWLIQKGRFEQAGAILRHMAKVNGKPEPDLSCLSAIAEKDASDSQRTKHYSYLDLFKTRTIAKNTLVMLFFWFSLAFVYYGLSINVIDLSGSRYINVFLAGIINFIFIMSIIFTAKFFGRKYAAFGYLMVATVALVSVIIMTSIGIADKYTTLTNVLCLIGRSGVSAAWTLAYLLAGELFPTVIRNIAGASFSMAGRVGGVLAPQLAYSIHISKVMPYVISGCFSLVSAILVVTLLPETKGSSLPETLPQKKGYCLPETSSDSEDEQEQVSFTPMIKNQNSTTV